jgi:hypothetical protein
MWKADPLGYAMAYEMFENGDSVWGWFIDPTEGGGFRAMSYRGDKKRVPNPRPVTEPS